MREDKQVRIDTEVLEALRLLAKKHGRTIKAQIKVLVEEAK